MKRLTLVRHAKSSWKNAALSDFDRPLNGRGKRDVPRIGACLAEQGVAPDIVLASPARRARKTAQLLGATLPAAAGRILFDPALYEADAALLLERVRALDEAWLHVMLVGHNPGLTDLVNLLANAGLDNLPTCGVAVIELEIVSWRQAAAGCGRVAFFVVPKALPAQG